MSEEKLPFKLPVKFEAGCGMFFDADCNHIADIRGWGYLQYEENPEKLQDRMGELIAEAINSHFSSRKEPNEQHASRPQAVKDVKECSMCKGRGKIWNYVTDKRIDCPDCKSSEVKPVKLDYNPDTSNVSIKQPSPSADEVEELSNHLEGLMNKVTTNPKVMAEVLIQRGYTKHPSKEVPSVEEIGYFLFSSEQMRQEYEEERRIFWNRCLDKESKARYLRMGKAIHDLIEEKNK